MARVVIIGAGLTGLSAAYHLEKKGFHDFIIVEKDCEPGGICRSLKKDGFTFDYTGHLLHKNDPYFSSFLETILQDEAINSIERKSYIYSQNVYTPYPYQINLHGLPIHTIVDCVEGYVKRKSSMRKPKSFAEWVLKYFGQGLARSFFFPYQSKLLRYAPSKLAASWTGRFVPQTSLRQMLAGALVSDGTGVGYNASFLYPDRGIGRLIDRLVKRVNRQVVTGASVVKIDLNNKLVIFKDGHEEPFDIIVNTMPLGRLLGSIHDRSTTYFNRAAHNLTCTSVTCLNLGLSCAIDSEKHWIYYPERLYPFYRLGFYHNFSKRMTPAFCSSMYIECSYRNKSERTIRLMVDAARSRVKQLFAIEDEQIATEQVLNIPHAYVVYDFWRERNLKQLLERLESESIYSVGRYGAWKYSSMQESVLDGKRIAEKIIVQPARRFVNLKKEIKQKKSIREKELL